MSKSDVHIRNMGVYCENWTRLLGHTVCWSFYHTNSVLLFLTFKVQYIYFKEVAKRYKNTSLIITQSQPQDPWNEPLTPDLAYF